jgi:two-component system response regulator DegU
MQCLEILLVDDHALTRQEIHSLVDAQDDLSVVAEAMDGEECIRLTREHKPDVILMDVAMPGMNGIEATRLLRDLGFTTRILAVSNHTGSNLVNLLFKAGVNGFIRKDQVYEELVPAIHEVAQGREFVGKMAED